MAETATVDTSVVVYRWPGDAWMVRRRDHRKREAIYHVHNTLPPPGVLLILDTLYYVQMLPEYLLLKSSAQIKNL